MPWSIMDVQFKPQGSSGLDTVSADALVVVMTPQTTGAKALGSALAKLVADAVKQGDLTLGVNQRLYVHRPVGFKARRLALSIAADGSAKAFKAAVAAGFGLLPKTVKQVAVAFVGEQALLGEEQAEAACIAALDLTYVYGHTKPSATPASALSTLVLLGHADHTEAIQTGILRGLAIGHGICTARELGNRPGNHCTPTQLGEQAEHIANTHGMGVEVLDLKAIRALGMGSFLAVAQGSAQPPRFIVMHYRGAPADQAPCVLVGKGITFDTGGISIKPAPEMDEMKFDMGGAASVLGAMAAIGLLRPAVNVVALIPTCENMPSGTAIKPGDVVKSMSGQTIEILNTDAEGRLILCDALTYAERFKPSAVVDVATLTGACVIALGHHHSGLYASDDALADDLLTASRRALDPAWRMPLDAEYDDALKSNFADMANVGPRAGGSITAAMFLKRYTSNYRWAHLDIAGTAWKSGAGKGATGRPVGLLTHFVLGQVKP
jgi:leucyl aminopeptidase